MKTIVLLLSHFLVVAATGATFTQSDWSGDTGVAGPVSSWENSYLSSQSISAQGGDIRLNGGGLLPVPVKHFIVNSYELPSCVTPCDIDGDGVEDVLSSSQGSGEICWWKNLNGTGNSWSKKTVQLDIYGGQVLAADVNGDSFLDVVAACVSEDKLCWWENINGTGIDWAEHNIVLDFNHAISIQCVDMDFDGDMDIVGAAHASMELTVFENDGGQGTSWATHSVMNGSYRPNNISIGDMNGDGAIDIAMTAMNDSAIVWYEQLSDMDSWQEHIIATGTSGCLALSICDLDADGDMDFVSGGYDIGLCWWENINGLGTGLQMKTIDADIDYLQEVYPSDMNSDGSIDLLVTESNNVFCYWNSPFNPGDSWTGSTVEANYSAAISAAACDLDGNMVPDVLAASFNDNKLNWWTILGEYEPQGSLVSSILDAGDIGEWNIFLSSSQEPSGTAVSFQFRSSNDPSDMGVWSDTVFTPDTPLEGILDDSTRYLQYRTILQTSSPVVSPELAEVAFSCTQVGIEESEFAEVLPWSLRASENPSIGFFSALVSVPEDVSVDLLLYDVSGRVVASLSKELPEGTHSVNFTELAQGVYFCTMRASDFSAVERVVVLR